MQQSIPLFNPEDISIEDGRTAASGEQWQRWILETLGSKHVKSFSYALGEDDLFFGVPWEKTIMTGTHAL